MGIFFEPASSDQCCLCGATDNLTGEHKIKASALRSVFGADRMVIGIHGDPNTALRSAQVPKSKELHFNSKICLSCNSDLTQLADREFDRFHKSVVELYQRGEDPKNVFFLKRYAPDQAAYLNVFRYFAKLLSCQMAEVSAPRRLIMTRFAIGESDVNCVWLDIEEDVSFKEFSAVGFTQYAAHGGLSIYGDKDTGGANGFHSTLTIGPIRYIFFSRLNVFERLAISFAHPRFHAWCRERVEAAKVIPIPHADQVRLGLAADKP